MNKLFEALQAGKSIENPEMWKQWQAAVPALVSIIGGIIWALKVFGIDVHLTDDQIAIIAIGVALVLSGLNALVTFITSTKIGMKPKDG